MGVFNDAARCNRRPRAYQGRRGRPKTVLGRGDVNPVISLNNPSPVIFLTDLPSKSMDAWVLLD